MNTYKMSFGKVVILQNNLAEIIVNDGIEFNEETVGELHDFILNNFKSPVGLLINKKHSYSYTFNAQKTIVHLDEIKSIAVLAKTSGAVMSTETLINVNGNIYRNIKLFQDRDAALVWLHKEIA